MPNEIISLSADLAIALSFMVGLVFGIAQVRAATRDRRERLTLEALHKFQSREFVELMQYITTNDLPSNRQEMNALPVNERIILIQFAQEMESLGILVAERFINVDLVDKTLGSLVVTAWEKYKIMFLDMREKQPDPFLGEYFQWLAEQIDQRMRKNPRKPFHETHKSMPGILILLSLLIL
jgi:hypothetical protein